jgi:hypothetical protein
MRRVLDPNEPWVCPPSLRPVFAKRHANQELRRAKGAARQAALELKEAQARVDALRPKGWKRMLGGG